MQNAEALETTEVPDIDGQQLSDAMNIPARCQASVMDLHTLECYGRQARIAIGHVLPDYPAAIRNPARSHAQADPFRRCSGRIHSCLEDTLRRSTIHQRLRPVADPHPLPYQCMKRLADRGVLGIIALLIRKRKLLSRRQAAPVGISRDPDTDSRVKRLHPEATESYGRTVASSSSILLSWLALRVFDPTGNCAASSSRLAAYATMSTPCAAAWRLSPA
jgi:hypothetical protein